VRSSRKHDDAIQFAALPWRLTDDGVRQVMLLTSRETGRWVIPKGWPMKRLKPSKAAEREAFEEAGLVGHIAGKRPIGVYHYEKRLPAGRLLCEVWVFLLRVDHQLDDWPEKAQRETQWFDTAEAARRVEEGALAEIILHAFANNVFAPGTRRRKHWQKRIRHSSSRNLLGSKSP
jgi:8-oxo-dGTP pyrophosphatase MutT (NUDIX family)